MTAAMYKNFQLAKPSLGISATANKEILHELYVGSSMQNQMNDFISQFREANPDAPPRAASVEWSKYENALGGAMVYDPTQKAMVPNTAGVSKFEDGSPNPDYKDYRVFFANGDKF
jgi:hypothetical protein